MEASNVLTAILFFKSQECSFQTLGSYCEGLIVHVNPLIFKKTNNSTHTCSFNIHILWWHSFAMHCKHVIWGYKNLMFCHSVLCCTWWTGLMVSVGPVISTDEPQMVEGWFLKTGRFHRNTTWIHRSGFCNCLQHIKIDSVPKGILY